MLLYTSKLREGETTLGSTKRDKTSRGRDGGKGRQGVAGGGHRGDGTCYGQGRRRGARRGRGHHGANISDRNGVAGPQSSITVIV